MQLNFQSIDKRQMLASVQLQNVSTYKHVQGSHSLTSHSAQQYHKQGCGISQPIMVIVFMPNTFSHIELMEAHPGWVTVLSIAFQMCLIISLLVVWWIVLDSLFFFLLQVLVFLFSQGILQYLQDMLRVLVSWLVCLFFFTFSRFFFSEHKQERYF